MKISGQSTIVHKPNYFHLAYTATTHRVPVKSVFGPGLIVFLVGCVWALRLKKSPDGRGIKIVFNRSNPQKIKYGLICLAIGFALLCVGYRFGEKRYDNPHSVTYGAIHHFRYDIFDDLSVYGTFPEDFVIMPDTDDWHAIEMIKRDAWRNPLHLVKDMNNGQFEYLIVSSGKDGKYNTKDDIISDPITPENITGQRIRMVSYQIKRHLEKGEVIPENIVDLPEQEGSQIKTSMIKDGWLNQMKLKRIIPDDYTLNSSDYGIVAKYFVISSGKDGMFETEDDIVSDPIIMKVKKGTGKSQVYILNKTGRKIF